MNRIRAAWSTITASPKRIAATVGVVVGALVVGLGFSLAVNAIRDNQTVGQALSVAASATGQPSSAPVTASPWPTTTPTASATVTASPSPSATPSATVPAPAAAPPLTPSVTPSPTPTASVGGGCDGVTVDEHGAVYVNGELVEDPWSAEYGEQMPMAVLRLGAHADSTSDSEVCLKVDLPSVIVTGDVEVCGDVIAEMPSTYGAPTIDGVEIPDRMLDVNSYPLLDIADVEDVSACLHVRADANDVHLTLSMAICPSARLGSDGELTIFVGDQEWTFEPEYVYDDDGALVIGETVDVGLDIRNYKDDVVHLVEMGVWVTPDCP